VHKKFNINFYLLVVTLSTAFPNLYPLYADHINKEISLKNNNSSLLNPISVGKFPLEKKYIGFKISNTDKEISLFISNVGNNAKFFKKINNDKINLEIETTTKKFIDKKEQNLSIPSAGIINARLYGMNKKFNLELTLAKEIDLKNVQIFNRGKNIEIKIVKVEIQREELTEENIFKIDKNALREITTNKSRAKAPPLGDIAIGTTLIPNPNLLNLDGPKVSLIFKQTQAKKALEFLLSKADYGFVWVQQDPSFDPEGGSGGLSAQGLNSESSSQLDSSLQGLSSTSAPSSEEKNADTHRYITLTLKDVSFKNAFNSVLMASGLQAKLENGIVYVGPNVRDSVFNARISRVYRLNQTTANAAASYLANLGAKVTQTSTLSTAVTQGATQSQTVSGASSSNTTTSTTTTSVQVYGSDIGPLLGLIATTDDRLQTVTMIGSPDVITVAEGYLKQLDLRQRQVALTVRILDVQLEDGTALSNSWALRQNDNFIVNDNGKLLSAFGKYLPPSESPDFIGTSDDDDIFTGRVTSFDGTVEGNRRIRLNPVDLYTNQNFIKFLRAQIVSANTKILANPTLILNEFPGRSGGETVAFSDISAALSSGSIGRTFGNEGFVIVGNQVPINCTSSDGDTASFEYGIAGLTFGARVLRVDDNGYVTFAISPSVSASSSIREIEGCGEIDLLSVRRLDTGSIRVKDGNTLILTGVLNATDKETITKFPFLGDIPIIGHFFRNRISGKDQRELVILVTPRILDGSDGQYAKSNRAMNISPNLQP